MASRQEAWKHIGLHGLSVGTFTASSSGVFWKSALLGRDDDDVSIARQIPAKSIKAARWTVFGRLGYLRIETEGSKELHHELRFDGFPPSDVDKLKTTFSDLYDITLEKHGISAAGTSYGQSDIKGRNLVFSHMALEDADEEGEEFEARVGDEMMSLDLAEVSQCVLPGNNRNEIELQFPESDTLEAGTDQLVSIRFYIPPEPDFESNDKETPSNAELTQQRIMKTASIKNASGDVIVEFPEARGTFLTPRGRYTIELYGSFLRMRGNKYDYKIRYDDISRLFLLPKPDEVHMAFVIALDKPIRQGQQRYQYLVLQTNKEQAEVNVNLEEDTLKAEYNGDLQPVMTGSFSNLVAKTFKVIAKKKVFIPGKFANANQQACVKCALRANEGLLYPLEKQFLFIHKPPVLIRFDEVESVEFQRYAGGQGSTRNFDLCVTLKASATTSTSGGAKEYTFSGIDRTDYTGLYNFLSGKKILIKNLEGALDEPRPSAPVYNENEIYGADLGPDDEEESEDDDFDVNDQSGDSESEDIDSDDLGSEIDEELDSDIEEARKKAGGASKKKSKKADSIPKKRKDKDEDDDGDDDVESKPKKAKKSTIIKKKGKKKDPNAPKRAQSSYTIFMSKNRAAIKEANPNATFGELAGLVSKAFKELSPEEKEKYEEMADLDKERYKREMKSYVPPIDSSNSHSEGNVSKKSKKKPKKDPNAPKKAMTSFMFYSNAIRSEVKEKNPDLAFGDIAKLIGKKFRELSEEEKKPWDEKADEDKKRYRDEVTAYKKKQVTEAAENLDSDGEDDDSDDDSD
mmetsp:Transcript_29066/g.43921  ORF Transcript_29066/g.43921 Transcript_29066/m.43921 type:complete len:800 (+) Transcript_29066:102-2501(+)|eukprot:CAMPEP_0178922088 /NCGR_PEP_ID=MMETSP0786-20121207/15947_1 /TAXON_ID=186022 /ORGANISM="Thalassionema frauenfeldii, Strain CCMP 1798" /LENGTH=799 /DNA_ID=CAMNT_0020596389 /DNA_START=88 /DNA_END=2487 /DNA_ORIENTATION=-